MFLQPTCSERSELQDFEVRNLRALSVETWGFNILWDQPIILNQANAPLQVDNYVLELWSGDVKIETQVSIQIHLDSSEDFCKNLRILLMYLVLKF